MADGVPSISSINRILRAKIPKQNHTRNNVTTSEQKDLIEHSNSCVPPLERNTPSDNHAKAHDVRRLRVGEPEPYKREREHDRTLWQDVHDRYAHRIQRLEQVRF